MRRVDGLLLLWSGDVHVWGGAVGVDVHPGSLSEVNGCVCILWEVMVVLEAVFELKLR